MKEIINVQDDKETGEIRKKMRQMEEAIRLMKGVGTYENINYSDLCIFLGAKHPDKF